MMNCAPVSCSKSESFLLSRSASVGPRMPARSVTHCVGGGGTSSAPAEKEMRRAQMNSALPMSARAGSSSRSEVEVDLGCLAAAGRTAEVSLLLEAAHARDQAGREAADRRVVSLRGFVVAAAFDGDAVLRPFELRLQLEESLIRPQLGIALHHDEQ